MGKVAEDLGKKIERADDSARFSVVVKTTDVPGLTAYLTSLKKASGQGSRLSVANIRPFESFSVVFMTSGKAAIKKVAERPDVEFISTNSEFQIPTSLSP